MALVLAIAAFVLAGFVLAAVYLPVWGLAILSAFAVVGIAYGAKVASRRDAVPGALGIYGAILLTAAVVVEWIVFVACRY